MSTIKSSDLKGLDGTIGIEPAQGPHTLQSAWACPGSAAFDFRSAYNHYSRLSKIKLIPLTLSQFKAM
jgi:hypothetical protein